MKKFLLITGLLLGISTGFAKQNLCTVKIAKSSTGKRHVLLMGGNAYDLLQKYLSDAKSRGISIDPGNVVVHTFEGSALKSYELSNLERLFSGKPVMQMWRDRLSKVESIYNTKELSKAHNMGWDIVCVGEVTQQVEGQKPVEQKKEEAKKGECSTEAKNHINIGIGFINNKQVDNAIREFSEAVRLSPTCPLAYANLVSAYVVKRNYNLAIETYKKGIEKAGEDGFLHMTGAIAYTMHKDFDLALVSLEKSLEKGYKNVDVLVSKDLKDLRTNKKKEFCDLMNKYSIAIKECIR